MRVTVKNISKSALDLPKNIRLFAGKEWTGEMDPAYVAAFEASKQVSVTRVDDADEEDAFREEYRRLSGKRADRRWSPERLLEEIEKLDPK